MKAVQVFIRCLNPISSQTRLLGSSAADCEPVTSCGPHSCFSLWNPITRRSQCYVRLRFQRQISTAAENAARGQRWQMSLWQVKQALVNSCATDAEAERREHVSSGSSETHCSCAFITLLWIRQLENVPRGSQTENTTHLVEWCWNRCSCAESKHFPLLFNIEHKSALSASV